MARKKKRVVTGNVVDIAAKGMAFCRTDEGEVFLVHDAVPGDRITALLTRKKKGLWMGQVQEFIEFSKDRVAAPCIHFENCGGCKWQNLDYQAQLSLKAKSVHDVMERIGGLSIEKMEPILGCDKIYNYRNKLEFTFSSQRWLTEDEMKNGEEITDRAALGFHRPGRFDKILDIKECMLQPSPSNEIRNYIKEVAIKGGYDFYNPRSQRGFLRNLIIRTTETGEVMVVLIVQENSREAIEYILSAVDVQFPNISSLQYVINPKANDSIGDLDVHLFKGSDYITEKLGDKEFRMGPKSFFQTNTGQAKELYDRVIEYGDFRKDETVYDLYCGLGSIGIYIAEHVRKVIGVEEVQEAVQWAKVNKELNEAAHCEFFCGDVRDVLTTEFIEMNGQPDTIIVDPPRAGLHPDVTVFIKSLKPKKIIYVSCNPATQARDLAHWSDIYDCKRMQPVDQFPHTSHIENIAVMHLKIQ